MLEIKDIPSFSSSRTSALKSVATCLSNNNEIPNIFMNDNNYRKTSAAATYNGIKEKFNNDCGNTYILYMI